MHSSDRWSQFRTKPDSKHTEPGQFFVKLKKEGVPDALLKVLRDKLTIGDGSVASYAYYQNPMVAMQVYHYVREKALEKLADEEYRGPRMGRR